MSIRLRLTLLYSTILAVTLIGLSAALYLTVARTTVTALSERLADQARTLLAAREFRFDRIILPASRFTPSETVVQTRRLDGTLDQRTPNLADASIELPLSAAGLQAIHNGEDWSETQAIGGEPWLIYSRLVTIRDQPIGILQLARSLEGQRQLLRTLRNSLVAGGSIVIVVAFGIGWMLAGTALRPINRITQTARLIGAEHDFDRRVDYSGPQDEVGGLATTFNTMLAELQVAYRQVEQALQTQRRFVADASHELRTPLTTIRGNLGLLQRVPPISADDHEAVLADMSDETDRLIRLVNDLLVLARADAGRSWRCEALSIKPIVEDVCRQAKLLDPGRRIDCDALAAAGTGNRDALKQVLLILLDNALKWTPPDGSITLSTSVRDGQVAVRVRDTGPGIAPEALPHIFERFYRGDTSRTGAGAGLGLAIAKTLMEAQHGTIAVESTVGHGSVFTISLPAATLPAEAEDEPALIESAY